MIAAEMHAPQASILIIFVTFAAIAKAHKLLVFSFTNSKSHMISNERIREALFQAGHNVTLLSFEFCHRTDEVHSTKHGRIIRMGSIDQDILQEFASKKVDVVEAMFKPRSLWDNYNMYKMFTSTCLTSFEPDVFGIPQPAGYVPAVANVDFSDQMTFLERADNTFQTWAVSKLFHDYFDATTDIFRRHWDPNFGDLLEYMRSSTPLIFVAVSEFMDFPRPIMHNVINIGGLGIKNTSSKISALPEPFATEIEKGARGVVFVSLGSIVNPTDLPDAVRRNLIDGLAAIHEYHVILKLEKEDSEGIAYAKTKRNIFVTHWAPQPQLLQHSRLKMFFTHGGYNSLQEVAQSGKPVLLMPFLYDQTRNAMMVQKNGWGHMFDRASLMKGSKQLENNLRMVLEDPKFEQSAKRIQNLLATKPFSANEIFIRNVQFVLDNNGTLPELNAASARLSFIHQFNLDIFILLGLVIVIVLICFVTFAIFLFRIIKNLVNMKKKVE
ncbi:UDP-glucoronosyl and UDP-glucosyl transferase domain-containing protein [Ditylenchus destructor]|nr:UDP-glucoronosyl and UDP-glucosyl transferase domain-containing protein [Ditylenchus destructor]